MHFWDVAKKTPQISRHLLASKRSSRGRTCAIFPVMSRAAGLFQSDDVEFKLFLTAGWNAQWCQHMSNVSVTEIIFG